MTHEEWRDIFGDNLLSLLDDRHMTQMDLAKDSGLSKSMISGYINKQTMPSLAAAINIAYALDVSMDELVNFDEPIEY